MPFDLRLDDVAPMRLPLRERAFLVDLDEPAVAGDVGRQDGREPSLYPLVHQTTLSAYVSGPARRHGPFVSQRVRPISALARGQVYRWVDLPVSAKDITLAQFFLRRGFLG